MPSARDCSRPNGPLRLGPMRCCMRATTRRSSQIVNSVMPTRNAKITTTLSRISHHVSPPKPPIVSVAGASVATSAMVPVTSWGRLRPYLHEVTGLGDQRAADGRAGGVARQPHHAVAHLGDGQRQRDRARGRCSRTPTSPSAAPSAAAVLGRQPRHRRTGGPGQVAARRPAMRPSSSSIRQLASTSPRAHRDHAVSARGSRRRVGPPRSARTGASPATRPSARSSRRAASTSCSPSGTPMASAIWCSTRASLSAVGSP